MSRCDIHALGLICPYRWETFGDETGTSKADTVGNQSFGFSIELVNPDVVVVIVVVVVVVAATAAPAAVDTEPIEVVLRGRPTLC